MKKIFIKIFNNLKLLCRLHMWLTHVVYSCNLNIAFLEAYIRVLSK